VPRKQPLKLIESFQKLAMDDLKAPSHLVLVGTGPLEQELRNMANGQQNIHFVGFKNQSEMPICYRIGDVLVLPSSRETWGLAVNEAMASGRPVIVSDKVGCAPDLVAGTPYGTVFSSNEPAALTNALKQWCVERPTALAAGALAAEAIMRWSPQAAAKAIADAAHRAAAESILLDGS
jgi:glycosyltransferase involved in cell wall biosynthesis